MKKMVLMMLLIFNYAYGQTYDEWFRQKKTQIKYLIEQIAALQVYAGYVEKGYTIAKDGLDAIQAIKNGDLSLHNNYFSSLKNVGPSVKAYAKIADIIALQISIVQNCKRQRKFMKQSGQFSNNEMVYAGKVFDNVLDNCTGIIDELTDLITDGLLQMKDDERIKRIDHLYNNMQDRFSFVQHFGNDNNILAVQRMKDQNDVKVSKKLYGIK
jgi:hypothetical protein